MSQGPTPPRDDAPRYGCLTPLAIITALAVLARGRRTPRVALPERDAACPKCEAAEHSTTCAKAREPKPVEHILREVMLELLYPAVLGAVLFEGLKLGKYALLTLSWSAFCGLQIDKELSLKCAFVALTVLFYGCDYVYIILTRRFRVAFFWYDCLFLLGLYGTFVAFHIEERQLHSAPAVTPIATLYALFCAGYFAWDYAELRDARDEAERRFYRKILTWEVCSTLAFGAVAMIGHFRFVQWDLGGILLAVLFISSTTFLILVREKHKVSAA